MSWHDRLLCTTALVTTPAPGGTFTQATWRARASLNKGKRNKIEDKGIRDSLGGYSPSNLLGGYSSLEAQTRCGDGAPQ